MINLTNVVMAQRWKTWKPGDADYDFIKRIITNPAATRQLSYEMLGNGVIEKTSVSGNFLWGLRKGDEFVIDGTHDDLRTINRNIKNHRRYLFMKVETWYSANQLKGKCY